MDDTLLFCCDDPDCALCLGQSVVWSDVELTLPQNDTPLVAE